MQVRVLKDTVVLVPNKDHQNFTASGEIIEGDSIISGNYKDINGLRRGQPFTYRLFITDKNQIIYQKSTTPMEATEVTLGADAQTSPTKVDMIPAENFSKAKMTGLIVGGIAGFAYAKYKKHDMKKAAMYIGIGAVAGYVTGMLIDRRKRVVIQPSK